MPAAVLSYFNTNYAQDTLVKAYKTHDSGYVVFSVDNGVFATTFNDRGTFISRMQLHDDKGKVAIVDQASLPDAIQSYLDATYPNFVFKQAFSFFVNGVVSGSAVCIEANGTKYAVLFDASGNFVQAFVIR